MIGALFILAGYVGLIWQFGWFGLAAVVAHVVVMLLAMGRKRPH